MVIGLISATLQIQLAEITGMSAIAAKITVESMTFLFNFLFLRDILFRGQRAKAGD